MIRFTRMAFGFSALALTAFMMTACAEGGQTDTADDTLDTTSEVISAEFPGGAAKVMEFIAGQVTYPDAATADGVGILGHSQLAWRAAPHRCRFISPARK